MTLVARDEADIVDAVVAFHLAAGVDFVVATDHCSGDETAEILEGYEQAGRLQLVRESQGMFDQSGLVTRMARLACTEHGADWVLNVDADEFWWPRRGSWKELLGAVPERFTVIRGAWRHFVPRADEGGHFAERMTLRLGSSGALTGREDPFHASAKVVHRGDPHVEVMFGNHDVTLERHAVVRGWFPFEVLHFPLRARGQARWKYERRANATPGSMSPHIASAVRAIADGEWDAYYDRYLAGDAPGAAAHAALTEDTRLRDALRSLAGVAPLSGRPVFFKEGSSLPALGRSPCELHDDVVFADETQVLQEREADVRFERRLRALERRVAELERGLGRRIAVRAKRATPTSSRP